MARYDFSRFDRARFDQPIDFPEIILSDAPTPFAVTQFQFIWDTLVPTENGVVDIGIIELETRAYFTPDFGRKYRAIIEIADNSNFDNSTVYTTDFVASYISQNTEYQFLSATQVVKTIESEDKKQSVSVTHAITASGVYYVKIYLEDDQGVTSTPYVYQFNAEQTLYFIEEPQVDTKAPQANSIMVKSPTASATATTDPAPADDELIEKIVEIDEGDATICQAVADKLIKKWGREQKSVSGPIDLTVTLEFEKKPKIKAPDNGIDEYMPLQRKEHRVTEGITHVTCGDINLSESELLARILDDLGV